MTSEIAAFVVGRKARMRLGSRGLFLGVCSSVALAVGVISGALLEEKLPALQRSAMIAWIDVTGPSTVDVPAFGASKSQRARFASASSPSPLVIDLHQWGEDEHGTLGDDARLDKLVTQLGWNYIRPALAGPNNTPSACCSRAIIDGMKAAINYALRKGKVDRRAIYVVGESGGAYTALCGAQSGELPVRAYYAWVPITDLAGWHSVHADDHYGSDVMACTSSHGTLDIAEARRRSPAFMPLPARMPELHIFHGIRDGMTTSVSPEHSIRYFNRIASETGFQSAVIGPQVEREVVYTRKGPDIASGNKVGDRTVHLFRQAGTTSLTIFEGKHEGLMKPTMKALAADWAALKLKH